jgi:hypothetical protein
MRERGRKKIKEKMMSIKKKEKSEYVTNRIK